MSLKQNHKRGTRNHKSAECVEHNIYGDGVKYDNYETDTMR